MREAALFNDGWRFHRGEAERASAAAYNDVGWRPLILPHDWSIEGPFDQGWASATGYLPGGIGWYRKTFAVPTDIGSRKVYIHFDGVYCNSEVWVNGQPLGHRPNGFISFRYDMTSFLAPDGPNTLAVRVDHSKFADARWYTGSGINRNVFLIVTDLVHIKQWGVFVTTPRVSVHEADVQVNITLQNHSDAPARMEIEHSLLNARQAVVASTTAAAEILSHEELTITDSLTVPNPALWAVDRPYLYVLQTLIRRNGQVIDRQETNVGIRTICFDANKGFFLNGENLKMKGVCLHDDAGALGTAVPVKVWERRLYRLKAAGVNAVRMAHNPHMPELYDLCDRMGLLVQDEAFDEWEGGKNKWIAGWNVGQPGKDGYHEHFQQWAEADLCDMILRDRNHPSVVMWSIGNEIDYPNDPYTHEILEVGTNPQIYGRGYQPQSPHSDRLGVVARQLAAIVKELDTTRPVTAALSAALISNETGFADALDVVGYNYQEYRYLDDHVRYPDRILYGSENGMRWDFWRAVADNPCISAQFLWTGIDYLGEAHGWPGRSNGAGLLDLAGMPKPEYFFRRSLWTSEPMIYIGTREVPEGEEDAGLWRHNKAEPVWAGTAGRKVRVNCFTNCAQAELFLNGRSLDRKARNDAEDGVLWWDVPYEPGTLSVQGIIADAVVASQELRTSGPPQKILAHADVATLAADGRDVAHIEVSVADEKGTVVYGSDNEIAWTIEGPARLLGLENGDHTSHEGYKGSTRRAFHGTQLGYVQSTEMSGSIMIRLTSPGLDEAVVVLETRRPELS